MPEVTVLTPIYNAGPYLREAVASILGQSFRDFEFLLIDDGSTDGSSEIVRSFNDPRIRLIRNETNQGVAATLNQGLALASGRYVARMDSDVPSPRATVSGKRSTSRCRTPTGASATTTG